MKNNIMYYYNLIIDTLYQNNNYYYFYLNEERYELTIYDRNIKEQQAIYELNKKMILSNIMVHEIILNKDNYVITTINNIPYILYKVYINKDKELSLSELTHLSNFNFESDSILNRNNWNILWSTKIDYLEYQINQIGLKYPILVDSFNYFVGLAENAISYAKNTELESKKELVDKEVISHRKLKLTDTINTIYDPINIITDHKSRDLAEYIKLSFFKNKKNIFNELNKYFSNNYYSIYGIRLLFARILYPSFYFDTYEEIIQGKINESEILNITAKIDEYEEYLKDIFFFLKNLYNIPPVEWLIKNS